MATDYRQRESFLALKQDVMLHSTASGSEICSDKAWLEFEREWMGFIKAIIRRRLSYYSRDLMEDAQVEACAKILRYAGHFQEDREPSPWIAQVVVSACEDIKRQYEGKAPRNGSPHQRLTTVSLDEGDFLELLSKQNSDSDPIANELLECLWCCVYDALNKLDVAENRKTAFLLFYQQGYRLREIADILHVSPSTVNNWPGSVLNQIIGEVKARMSELGYGTISQDNQDTVGRQHRVTQGGV